MSTATSERNAKGQFAPGNAGGPGNPFARQVAELRKTILAVVTPEVLASIMQALAAKAQQGDMAASKLLLEYTVGKPVPMSDPDRVDADEWEKFKEVHPMIDELPKLVKSPGASLPLTILRETKPHVTNDIARMMGAMLKQPEKYRQEEIELEMVEEEPSTNGVAPSTNGPSPSANGSDAMTEAEIQTLLDELYGPETPVGTGR